MKGFVTRFIASVAFAATLMVGNSTANATEELTPRTTKVPAGSNLTQVATEAGCSYSDILRMNPDLAANPNDLKAGDYVVIGYDRYWVIDNNTPTFSSLVRQSGLTSDEVKRLNPKDDYNHVEPGDKFYLGSVTTCSHTTAQATNTTSSSTAAPAGYVSYTVQQGDYSVSALSRKFGVSNNAIISPNPSLVANPDLLVVGQTILVPASCNTTTQVTNTTSSFTAPAGYVSYTVQPGDYSVSALAKRYGVSNDTIISPNPSLVANPDLLVVGQTILVPAATPSTPATRQLIGSSSLSRPGVAPSSWANIQLSANRLDGLTLAPGETFDWFRDMGRCGISDGYVNAGAYSGGKTISAPGGGICFTSTGLMQAARDAGCADMVYYDHSLPVTYATRGNEGCISWGSKNLIFRNPYTYSIMFDSALPSYGELRFNVYAVN